MAPMFMAMRDMTVPQLSPMAATLNRSNWPGVPTWLTPVLVSRPSPVRSR